MNVKLLTKQHLEFLSLPGGCTGLSVSTLVKIPHCWTSHDAAQIMEVEKGSDQKLAQQDTSEWVFNPFFTANPKWVLWQTMKAQMKCRKMWHFIRACTVC